jgi:hypothetical protein
LEDSGRIRAVLGNCPAVHRKGGSTSLNHHGSVHKLSTCATEASAATTVSISSPFRSPELGTVFRVAVAVAVFSESPGQSGASGRTYAAESPRIDDV